PLVTGAVAAAAVGVVGLTVAAVLLAAAADRERTARGQAEQARDAAREQRRRARDALDAMTSQEALDWLTAQRDLLPQQQAFLERALAYYQKFADEAGADADGRAELAGAHYRVGRIYQALGRTAPAVGA